MSKAKIVTIEELRKNMTAESLELNEDGSLNDEPQVKLYTETLPVIKVEDKDYRLTLNDADALREHDKRFGQVFGEVSSQVIAKLAKDKEDMAAAELTVKPGAIEFSTVWARPKSDEPTKKELSASIGFGMSHPISKTLEGKVRTDFAKSFLEEDDE